MSPSRTPPPQLRTILAASPTSVTICVRQARTDLSGTSRIVPVEISSVSRLTSFVRVISCPMRYWISGTTPPPISEWLRSRYGAVLAVRAVHLQRPDTMSCPHGVLRSIEGGVTLEARDIEHVVEQQHRPVANPCRLRRRQECRSRADA